MNGLEDAVRAIVEWARLAPSVHNTQPWAWRIEDDHVWLCADRSRWLSAEDPAGRDLVISCGAALHHFWYVAGALGWDARVERLPEGMRSDLLAKASLQRGGAPDDAAERLALVGRRCTDRQQLASWPVRRGLAQRLCREAEEWGCRARLVRGAVAPFRVELLAGRARARQAADPAAAGEQQRWTGRGGADGIPRAALPGEAGRWDQRSRYRPSGAQQPPTAGGSERLLVLGGDDDQGHAWLRTGEGLSALWLLATGMGISVVPLTQPTEVDDVRAAVRHVAAGGQFAPHVLVRVGWPTGGRLDLPRTPRRPVTDVLRI